MQSKLRLAVTVGCLTLIFACNQEKPTQAPANHRPPRPASTVQNSAASPDISERLTLGSSQAQTQATLQAAGLAYKERRLHKTGAVHLEFQRGIWQATAYFDEAGKLNQLLFTSGKLDDSAGKTLADQTASRLKKRFGSAGKTRRTEKLRWRNATTVLTVGIAQNDDGWSAYEEWVAEQARSAVPQQPAFAAVKGRGSLSWGISLADARTALQQLGAKVETVKATTVTAPNPSPFSQPAATGSLRFSTADEKGDLQFDAKGGLTQLTVRNAAPLTAQQAATRTGQLRQRYGQAHDSEAISTHSWKVDSTLVSLAVHQLGPARQWLLWETLKFAP